MSGKAHFSRHNTIDRELYYVIMQFLRLAALLCCCQLHNSEKQCKKQHRRFSATSSKHILRYVYILEQCDMFSDGLTFILIEKLKKKDGSTSKVVP